MSFVLRFLVCPALAFAIGCCLAHRLDETAIAKLKLAQASDVAARTGAALEFQKSEDAATLASALKEAAAQARVRTFTRTIIEKVPVYVSRKADSRCVVPNGFVRMLDAAASGSDPASLPGTSGESDDAPSGIGLSQIATLSAENDGRYRAVAEELKALQAWVRAEAAAGPQK